MKKKYIFGIIVIIIIAVIGFYAFGEKGKVEQVEASPAELSVLAASVWSGPDANATTEAQVGTSTISTGDYIKTGEKGRAIVVSGKAQISLDYNSEIVIAESTTKGSSIGLTLGAVWSRVEKLLDKGEYSEIKTKNAVASVRGTSFGLYYKDDETVLMVVEGTVQFTPLDETGKLQSGKSVYVKAGNKAVKKGNEDFVLSEFTFNDTEDEWFQKNAPEHVLPNEEEIRVEEQKAKEEEKQEQVQNITPTPASTPDPVPTTSTTGTTGNTSSGGGSSSSGSTVTFELLSVSPETADVGSGEIITLSGKGFKTASKVEANGTSIAFEIINDTTIEIIAGEELPQDVYDITVRTRAGESTTLRQVLEIRELGRSINEADR